MRRPILYLVTVAICLAPQHLAFGGTITVSGSKSDGDVDVNGLGQDFTLAQLRAGVGGDNLRGHAPILFFALPTVSSPALITSATLNLRYLGISQFTVTTVPDFNADLFGIGARSTPTILSTDYYDGNPALSSNTLLAQNFITPSTAPGNLQASGSTLLNFIKSLYNPDGTPTADYVVFRVNADIHLPEGSGPYRGYELASADYPDSSFVPQLELTVVPEPSTLALVAVGITTVGVWGIRRFRRQASDAKAPGRNA